MKCPKCNGERFHVLFGEPVDVFSYTGHVRCMECKHIYEAQLSQKILHERAEQVAAARADLYASVVEKNKCLNCNDKSDRPWCSDPCLQEWFNKTTSPVSASPNMVN